jgi:oxalate decarboxylase
MRVLSLVPLVLSCHVFSASASPAPPEALDKRQAVQGQPIDAQGRGGRILGGTNKQIDMQNPDNLGGQSTDNGNVPNFKYSFSNSRTRLLKGGWVREQVITDLPSAHDVAAAQMHLKKGAMREMHWHRVVSDSHSYLCLRDTGLTTEQAEWGIVYNGSVLVSAIDENGHYEVANLTYGDIWYFPKGAPHAVQGLEEENEFLLVFDDADFDRAG